MQLKSIYIKGFKSFPVETVIHFNERVTGVVGPNGSGKSNIVDAIRWVLGEQKTTELRLGEMTDVLFNGTKKRNKSGLAQVTLNFDNTKNLIPTEYSQVSISRLLFRNGESEYRINDVPCRLKDIKGMFADTGVSSDSYAIIALNMVDELLTNSNGSRVRMLEQASGISRYKQRKKETIHKLQSTEIDLSRVEDLLFEISNNLESLEKQAKRVERYNKIREEYKNISVQLHLRKYDELLASSRSVETQVTDETIRLKDHEVKVALLEADLMQEKKTIVDNESHLSSFQKEINELLDKIRKLENQKDLNRQQIVHNEQKLSQTETEQGQLEVQLSEYELIIRTLSERVEEEQLIHKAIEEKAVQLIADYEAVRAAYFGAKADHDNFSGKRKHIEESRHQFEKSLAVLENQIENLEISIHRKRQMIEQLLSDTKSVKQDHKNTRIELNRLELQLKDQQDDRESKNTRIQELTRQRNELRAEKDKVTRKMDARANEYDLIKSMLDSLEGYPESIKFLNKHLDTKPVILSDLLYAPDKYKITIENFLEPYLNYFVVESFSEAADALFLLQKAQKGKANFFVLDLIPEQIPVTDELDGLQPALNFLEYEEKYHRLISRLLHNVYITDLGLDDIDLLSSGFKDEPFFILDKNGTFTTTNFSVSGGSVGLFEGKKIGRRKNLEKLEDEIRRLKQENSVLDNKIIQIGNDIGHLEAEMKGHAIDELKSKIQQKNIQMAQFSTVLSGKDQRVESMKTEVNAEIEDIGQMRSLILKNRQSIQQLDVELAELLAGNNTNDSSLQAVSDKLSEVTEAKNQHNIELIKHQNLISTIETELGYKLGDRNKMSEKFENNKVVLTNLARDLASLDKEVAELEQSLLADYERKKQMELQLGDAEKEFYEKRGRVNELEEQVTNVRRSISQSGFLVNELKDKLQDVQYKVISIRERLQIEFHIELEDILNQERSSTDLAVMEEEQEKLKRRLENYGEINTLAIEAYQEMKERFETISGQRDDILTAKKSLIKTIDEIEKVATQKYLETFEVVNAHFKRVFTRLFSEDDTCEIIMEDPDNPLESGLEIIAKPKGKRPKTLSQLSGGEKTLTAIALLFSLYLYKPAPFCIFDEVDAPLDDSNIEKFNRIVKEFSKDSQFIIITHNKATMAAVDVLYGVFMQEMGVSEVAAVDFRDYEHLDTVETSGFLN